MSRSSNARNLRRVLSLARRLNAAEDGRPVPTAEPRLGWSRRHFMRVLAGTGAAAATISSTNSTAWAASGGTPRIVILGAGLAGLNAAYQLKRRGIASAVYEARQRVGGRVHTVRDVFGPGSITDVGGELVNSNHVDMIGLAKDFGIGLFDRLADGEETGDPTTAYLIHGNVMSEAEVAGKCRRIARRIGLDAAKLDEDPDRYYPLFDKLSAKEYLDRNSTLIPELWVRELLEQSVRSEYGVEPDQASALVLLYNLPVVEGEEIELLAGSDEHYLVEGGAAAIPKAMANYLGDAVHLGTKCEAITRTSGGSYRIKFEGGLVVSADILICSLPLTVLRRLNLDLQLPGKFLRFIHEVNLGINEKVIAGFKRRFWREDQLFANEFWSTGAFTSGWDAGQRQPEREDGVLTFYTGASGSMKALQDTPRGRASLFVEKLSRCYPQAVTDFTGRALRTNWTNDSFARGAYTNFAPGQTTRFGEFSWYEDPEAPEDGQEVRFKDAYFIGEHVSSEFYGFMNGGAETGRLAATAILQRLGVL